MDEHWSFHVKGVLAVTDVAKMFTRLLRPCLICSWAHHWSGYNAYQSSVRRLISTVCVPPRCNFLSQDASSVIPFYTWMGLSRRFLTLYTKSGSRTDLQKAVILHGRCYSSSSKVSDGPSSVNSSATSEENVDDLESRFRNDPQVKAWLKDITADFSRDGQDSNVESSSSSSGSDSDSDSSIIDTESTRLASRLTRDSRTVVSGSSGIAGRTLTAAEVDEELQRYDYEEFEAIDEEFDEAHAESIVEETHPISTQRGQTGVFDIEEMVTVLREDNARDICVIHVPKEMNYVDHMVIATGRSLRHLKAMAEYIKKLYKLKRVRRDHPTCHVEGMQSSDWLAIDLGNMAVHLFLADTREVYDLETLWTVGAAFDDKLREAENDLDTPAMFLAPEHMATFNFGGQMPKHVSPRKNVDAGHEYSKQRCNTEKQTRTSLDSSVAWHDDAK